MKPIWLLDIDGVINAVAVKPPQTWPAGQWLTFRAQAGSHMWWSIQAAVPVLEFLRHVHASGLAEIRWHSTWQQSAIGLARKLDLPDWPVVNAPERLNPAELQWWKLPAVWRTLLEGRPVLWTDDDATWELSCEEEDRLTAAGVLVVSPDPGTGLCLEHLRQIDAWLLEHAANQPEGTERTT